MTQLTHVSMWGALDLLAARHGVSTSRLAILAGLDATSFNKSKRGKQGRKHWPSTQALAAVLEVTSTDLETFTELVAEAAAAQARAEAAAAQAQAQLQNEPTANDSAAIS